VESASERLARRLGEESPRLAELWLSKLLDLLPVDVREVFPSRTLLDHIPSLLVEIAAYVSDPAENELLVSSLMASKAAELGQLRFSQKASVHQILREYEFLAEILEEFVHDETRQMPTPVSVEDAYRVIGRLHRAIRVGMKTTVDTFVASYEDSIATQQQRLEDFNRMVSHELRSPMQSLAIASSLLETAGDPAGSLQTKAANLIRGGVEQMERILVDLESLSRTGSIADASLGCSLADVGAMARDVKAQLHEMAAARGVSLRIAEDLPLVRVDGARLQMVLANLIANAIKYSDPAKVERWVEVVTGAMNGEQVEILVRDNGLGLAGDDRERIFERSVRAHQHLDSVLGAAGSGLGLTIVKECLAAIGGEIDLESTPGEGSTFSLRLRNRA
jgi:signal transduction histidine kinase